MGTTEIERLLRVLIDLSEAQGDALVEIGKTLNQIEARLDGRAEVGGEEIQPGLPAFGSLLDPGSVE